MGDRTIEDYAKEEEELYNQRQKDEYHYEEREEDYSSEL